jgi:hypothetical protein
MTGTSRRCATGAGDRSISWYLAEIAARLPGPARVRRDILAELGAGLADAAGAYRGAGLDAAQAARAAITEFGSPDQVAAGFRAELTAARARRTAFALIASGPLIGTLWVTASLASHLGALPWQSASLPAGARLAMHLAVIVLAAAICSALLTMATTGRLTRRLTGHPAASAAIAASGTAAWDLALLTVLAAQAASSPGRLAALPVSAAAAASLTRLTLAARAARNCLTTRGACPPSPASG